MSEICTTPIQVEYNYNRISMHVCTQIFTYIRTDMSTATHRCTYRYTQCKYPRYIIHNVHDINTLYAYYITEKLSNRNITLNIHIDTRTDTHTDMYTQICTHRYAHTDIHIDTHRYTHTDTHTNMHTATHTDTLIRNAFKHGFRMHLKCGRNAGKNIQFKMQ